MRSAIVVACLALALNACKTETPAPESAAPSTPAPAAEPAKQASEQDPQRAMAGAMGELGKALGAMAAAGAKAGPVVPYDEIKPLLPDTLAGLPGAGITGGTSALGTVGATEATREYTAEGKRLKVKIVDSPMAGNMASAAMGMSAMAMQETDTLVEKPYTHGVYQGRIKIHKKQKRAEAVLMVKRIIVEIDAEGFDDTAGVQAALNGLDLDGLAKLLSPTRKKAPAAAPAK